MRPYWPLLLLVTVASATSWFGADDPVDCSSILSPAPSSTAATYSQASHTISTIAAQATRDVVRAFDDTKDYVYSTWDDSSLRKWLEDRGVVEARKADTRTELIHLANSYFRKTSDPVWQSWSDSYMREWLVAHNLLSPQESPSRESLTGKMKHYYYYYTEKVWDTWSASELKAWLVNHGLLKSDSQKQRDELIKIVEDHYSTATDSIWGAWSDSDIREWLSAHGYIDERTALKKTREDLVKLINSKYTNASERSASYLTWPDARLRAYLRERGVSEDALPTSRPGLLQETRIRWVQASTQAESVFEKLRDLVNYGVSAVENALGWACHNLAYRVHKARVKAKEVGDYTWEKGYKDPFRSAGEGVRRGGENVKQAGEQIRSKGDEF
ncbi:hypothetical protein ID866_6521 [Astraeus odoratus]|nr:hypothetical protein ID866_6521 [Astraeus odoratus]